METVDLTIIREASGLDDEQLIRLPTVLVGSPHEIADRLLRYREQFGVSYLSVLEPHRKAFAEVILFLRGDVLGRRMVLPGVAVWTTALIR